MVIFLPVNDVDVFLIHVVRKITAPQQVVGM